MSVKLRRSFVALFVLASALTAISGFEVATTSGSAFAYNLENCTWALTTVKVFNNGPNQASYFQTGEQHWNNQPDSLFYYIVPTLSAADLETADFNFGNTGYDGLTTYTCLAGHFVTANVRAELNTYYTIYGGYSANEIVSVATHELGHAGGLAHNNPPLCNGTPLMYYSTARYVTCGIYTPQQDDINGMIAMYG